MYKKYFSYDIGLAQNNNSLKNVNNGEKIGKAILLIMILNPYNIHKVILFTNPFMRYHYSCLFRPVK